MPHRANVFTQRGGDSVITERLAAGLKARKIEVVIDPDNREDPARFDLVHLWNFALPDLVKFQAERAKAAGKPFVVTTLYEDVPRFHNQSIILAEFLKEYVRRGQDPIWYKDHLPSLGLVQPAPRFQNDWVANHADCLLVNGAGEAATLQRDYPQARRIAEVHLGCDFAVPGYPGPFERTYGVKDYVLAVGRIESRKNQLMLLKALEQSELTVVLASGGFTYQPEYDQAVRNFKRRGRTIIVDRLSPEMLASAYAGAKVHALPSWYELPGLIHIEAGYHGCNLVATDVGTTRDYLGSLAFYCEPADENSIQRAVEAAYAAPLRSETRRMMEQWTIDRMVNETVKVYEELVPKRSFAKENIPMSLGTLPSERPGPNPTVGMATKSEAGPGTIEYDLGENEYRRLVAEGEAKAKQMCLVEAHELLAKAESLKTSDARVFRARGAVYLAEGMSFQAKTFFQKALALDPSDSRSLSGMGMCRMNDGDYHDATQYLLKAIALDGTDLVSMRQLIECSYRLNRFDELLEVLTTYCREHPQDNDMRFCQAGALYKLQRFAEAESMNNQVLATNPAHAGGVELKKILAELPKPPATSPREAIASQIKITNQYVSSATTPPTSALTTPTMTLSSIPPTQSVQSAMAMPAVGMPASTLTAPSSPAPRTASSAPAIPAAMSAENALAALDEKKRMKQFAELEKESKEFLAQSGLSTEHQERAQILLAEAYVLTGKIADAREQYAGILNRNPNSARGLCGRGALAAHENNWASARESFEQSLAIQPEYDIALAGLGVCKAVEGDGVGAWDYYWRAVKKNPENTRALLGVIEYGYRLGRLPELQQALTSYLEMHPGDLEFLYSLAGCLFAQGRLDEARTEVEKIILFRPEHERAHELWKLIAEKDRASAAAS